MRSFYTSGRNDSVSVAELIKHASEPIISLSPMTSSGPQNNVQHLQD